MKIIQAVIIGIFIFLVPFLAYIWMLGYPLKVGYYSIYIYTFLVFLLVLYPLRNVNKDKEIIFISYFKQLGRDVYIACINSAKFLYDCLLALLRPFTFFRKRKQNHIK